MNAIGDAIVLSHRDGSKYLYVKAIPAASTTRREIADEIADAIDVDGFEEGDIVADVEVSNLVDEPEWEWSLRQ